MNDIYDLLKIPQATVDPDIPPSALPGTPEYQAKMIHPIPDAEVVDRVLLILSKCKGKQVLNLGSASGQLHDAIKKVAKGVIGVDKAQPSDIMVDLDTSPEWLEKVVVEVKPELIVAGEIIEHLANPGNLLKALRTFNCPLLITAPNAFTTSGTKFVTQRAAENVNRDHVAWYSYVTLKNLLERYSFKVEELYWYKGKPRLAEGLIMLAR